VRGSIGLVIGVALGAGAMYLVLRPPWAQRTATHPGPPDGPPVVMVTGDAGVPHPKKRRRPRPAAAGQPAPAGSDGEINQTVSSQAGGVRDCVVQGATGTDLAATITVKLLVDGHGRVTRSRIQAPHYLFEHGLLGCTQRALARMHFPAAGGATIVTLPVTLG
jgi:hypothetical protein